MATSASGFGEDDAFGIVRDAKIVAIRWDIIPWGLVLDMDAPVEEVEGTPERRVWLAFIDVGEITWPIHNSRLPNGCFVASWISVTQAEGPLDRFCFSVQLPIFARDDQCLPYPNKEVTIDAPHLIGAASKRTSRAMDQFGLLPDERNSLATDSEMKSALMSRLLMLPKEQNNRN